MYLLNQKSKKLLGVVIAPIAIIGCSYTPEIVVEDGYEKPEYIVPIEGKILISGETPNWENSNRLARQKAEFKAFQRTMFYIDNINVKHYREERSISYVLKKGNGVKQGFQNHSLVK